VSYSSYDPNARGQHNAFVFPKDTGPQPLHSWCTTTPRYLKIAALRVPDWPFGQKLQQVVAWGYARAARKGYFHSTGACPGHRGVTCNPDNARSW
jgi:hypothetical protein